MMTVLAGGTGTQKLLTGSGSVSRPAGVTVAGDTGDDVELGGPLACPGIDTVHSR